MIDQLVPFVGQALLHSLWQGAAIVAITVVLLRLIGRSSAVRYLVLCGALTMLVVAPIATALTWRPRSVSSERLTRPQPASSVSIVTPPSAPVPAEIVPSSDAAPRLGVLISRLRPVVVAVWTVGVLLGLLRIAGGWLAIQRLVRRATLATPDLTRRARVLAAALGVSRRVSLLISSEIAVPFAAGLIRPVIVLPVAAIASLSPLHLDAILAHELAHIRRWDYLVNVLQALAETLLFFHPAAWWLSRRIRDEREYCADDVAITGLIDPIRYAHALAELEGIRDQLPMLATALHRGALTERIARVIGRSDARPTIAWVPLGIALLALVTLVAVREVEASRQAAPSVLHPSEPGRQQGDVIRAPDYERALRERWTWALAEGRRRGMKDITIGWRIRAVGSEGDLVASSTRGGSWQDRGAVVSNLVGESDSRGVAFLLTVMPANSGELVAVAIRSLAGRYQEAARIIWLGDADDRESIDMLDRLASSAPASMRSELAAALTLHDDAVAVIAAAERIYRGEDDPLVRAELIAWLPRQRSNSPAAMALIDRALADPSPVVRDEALSALRNGPDGASILLAAASSRFPDVRSEAIQGLVEAREADPAAVVRVITDAAFDDPSDEVQREAVDALVELDTRAARSALRRIAEDHPRPRLRREAAEALSERR